MVERIQDENVLRMLGEVGTVTPGQDVCQIEQRVLLDPGDGTRVTEPFERLRSEGLADDGVRGLVSPETSLRLIERLAGRPLVDLPAPDPLLPDIGCALVPVHLGAVVELGDWNRLCVENGEMEEIVRDSCSRVFVLVGAHLEVVRNTEATEPYDASLWFVKYKNRWNLLTLSRSCSVKCALDFAVPVRSVVGFPGLGIAPVADVSSVDGEGVLPRVFVLGDAAVVGN